MKAERTPEQLLTARWRESFLIAWEELPDRVSVPGRSTPKGNLLAAAMRLAAVAWPDGKLAGQRREPFTVNQLMVALGRSTNTTQAFLHWFEATGWLCRRQTPNRRDADERSLVIPEGAVIAWPGWPLASQPVNANGETPSASQPSNANGETRNEAVPAAAAAAPAEDPEPLASPFGRPEGVSRLHLDALASHRLNSSAETPPGIPGAYPESLKGGLDTPLNNPIKATATALAPSSSHVQTHLQNGANVGRTDWEEERLRTIRQLLETAMERSRFAVHRTPKARDRWSKFFGAFSAELAQCELSESLIKRRAQDFFCEQVWSRLGDEADRERLRRRMFESNRVHRRTRSMR
ncbi:MAG: hypothetical protein ACHQ0J_05115 [Candidatus Dormibacterales bacterium]